MGWDGMGCDGVVRGWWKGFRRKKIGRVVGGAADWSFSQRNHQSTSSNHPLFAMAIAELALAWEVHLASLP